MKRSTQVISGIAGCLFFTSLLGFLVCLSRVSNHSDLLSPNYPLLAGILVITFLLDLLMTGKGVPAPLFIVLQIFFCALNALSFLAAFTMDPVKRGTIVLFCTIWVIFYLAAVYTLGVPTSHSSMSGRFDFLTIMMIILFFLDRFIVLSNAIQAEWMCGIALIVCVLALISDNLSRSSAGGSSKQAKKNGRLLLVGVTAFIVLLAAIVYIMGSGRIRSFSELIRTAFLGILHGIRALTSWLWSVFDMATHWLASVVHFSNEMVQDEEEVISTGDVLLEFNGSNISVPWYFYLILSLIAVAVLILLIWKLHGVRITRRSHSNRSTKAQRDSQFSSECNSFIARFRSMISFRIQCIKLRHTAPGLLLYCERHVPHSAKRKAGESGESFLIRLTNFTESEEEKATLKELAVLVERTFYAKGHETVPDTLYHAVRSIRYHSH